MRFAQFVFVWAGVWGLTSLTPSFLLVDTMGGAFAAQTDYPYFLGLLCAAAAWQIVLIVIASDPGRYRPLMIPAAVAKAGFALGMLAPRLGQPSPEPAQVGPEVMFAMLFIVVYIRLSGAQTTPANASKITERRGSEVWSGVYGVSLRPENEPSRVASSRGRLASMV